MKKKLAILCVLVLLVAGLAVNAHAADKILVAPEELTISANSGEDIAVPIKVTNVADNVDELLCAVIVKVDWDSSVLDYTGFTPGDVSTSWSGKSGTNVGYQDGSAGMSGDFTLITLKFKVKDSALTQSTEIKLTLGDEDALFDQDEADISNLGESKNATINITHNHEMTKNPGTPHTCDTAGTKDTWTCSKCENTYIDETGTTLADEQNKVDPAAHTFGEGTKTEAKESDCTNYGNNAYWTCSVCNKVFKDNAGSPDPEQQTTVQDETLKTLGSHKMETIEAKPATCTENGNQKYYYCSACDLAYGTEDGASGSINKDDMTIEKLNHKNATEYVPAKAVNVTEDGKVEPGYHAHYRCPDCKTYFYATDNEDGSHSIDLTRNYGVEKEDGSMPDELLINKVPGDVNVDTKVNSADVIRLQRYLAGGFDDRGEITAQGLINADVNADTKINSADVIRLQRYLAGGFDERGELK